MQDKLSQWLLQAIDAVVYSVGVLGLSLVLGGLVQVVFGGGWTRIQEVVFLVGILLLCVATILTRPSSAARRAHELPQENEEVASPAPNADRSRSSFLPDDDSADSAAETDDVDASSASGSSFLDTAGSDSTADSTEAEPSEDGAGTRSQADYSTSFLDNEPPVDSVSIVEETDTDTPHREPSDLQQLLARTVPGQQPLLPEDRLSTGGRLLLAGLLLLGVSLGPEVLPGSF